MVIDLKPVTQQLDTFESVDVLSPEFLTYPELKLEFIRYITGENNNPHFPLPAIPLSVHWDEACYAGLIWIDDNSTPDDPVMVYAYDTWCETRVDLP